MLTDAVRFFGALPGYSVTVTGETTGVPGVPAPVGASGMFTSRSLSTWKERGFLSASGFGSIAVTALPRSMRGVLVPLYVTEAALVARSETRLSMPSVG